LSHLPTCGYYWVLSDEISLLSHTSQVDEMEFLSGVSQSRMGDKLIKIVQYCLLVKDLLGINLIHLSRYGQQWDLSVIVGNSA
jgi:hypothetical protein